MFSCAVGRIGTVNVRIDWGGRRQRSRAPTWASDAASVVKPHAVLRAEAVVNGDADASVAFMRHSVRVKHADLQAFARVWSVQRERLAWLVGAGTSAAAGVPTAGQIVDDLLTRLYASAFDTVREKLDTGDPAVMACIRTYFDGRNGMPPAGDPSDYSTAFHLAFPEPKARSKYFRDLVNDRVPSFGQRSWCGRRVRRCRLGRDDQLRRAAGILMAAAHARHSSGTARLCSVAALGSTDRASAAVASDSWPLLIKLHGDYRESELKNLDSELRTQDERLRQAVIDASRRMGLVVAGYSGRDESVMEMLRAACQTRNAWPAGIWWLHRNPADATQEVIDLLEFAAAHDVSANLVEAANFDEAMAALANQIDLTQASASTSTGSGTGRWPARRRSRRGTRWLPAAPVQRAASSAGTRARVARPVATG